MLAGCTPAALMGAAVVVTSELAAAEAGSGHGSAQRPPEMTPDRKVNEVDCSKPIDFSLGNIRCK